MTQILDMPPAPAGSLPAFAPSNGPSQGSSSRRTRSCFDRDPDRTVNAGPIRVSLYDSAPERMYVVEPRDGIPIGNVFWVHGLTDHPARQFDGAAGLAKLGYRTILFDLQGHGGREMRIEQSWWIKLAYLDGRDNPAAVRELLRRKESEEERLLSDIRKAQYETLRRTSIDDHLRQFNRVLTLLLDSDWGALPLYLFGHSMGGLICVEGIRRFELRARAHLRGLMLMAPAFQPIGRPDSRTENALIEGFWRLSNRPSPLSLIRPAAKQLLSLNFSIDVSWGAQYVSDEIEENRLVDQDPLCHRSLPSGYVSSIESQLVRTNQAKLGYLPNTMILLPQDDAIVNTAGSLSFAQRARAAIGRSKFSLVQFPYLRAHHLLRSSVRAATQSAMADWLEGRACAGD